MAVALLLDEIHEASFAIDALSGVLESLDGPEHVRKSQTALLDQADDATLGQGIEVLRIALGRKHGEADRVVEADMGKLLRDPTARP